MKLSKRGGTTETQPSFIIRNERGGDSIDRLNTGEKGVPNAYSCVLSKHTGAGMMKANCQDLAGRRIQTASVSPRFTNTEMLRAHIGHDAGVHMQIARKLLFCAENPVINGALIHANLGQVEK